MAVIAAQDVASLLRSGGGYPRLEELPEVKANETIIPLSSLDDLVRIADDLVKPVLHKVEEGRHTYCIIEGGVRYQYLLGTSSKEEPGGQMGS